MVYPPVSGRLHFVSGYSSFSFHWIGMKLGGQLDHTVVQCILFRGYSTPNFDRVIAL